MKEPTYINASQPERDVYHDKRGMIDEVTETLRTMQEFMKEFDAFINHYCGPVPQAASNRGEDAQSGVFPAVTVYAQIVREQVYVASSDLTRLRTALGQ